MVFVVDSWAVLRPSGAQPREGKHGKLQQKRQGQKQQQRIQDDELQQREPKPKNKTRPLCTETCLLGLAYGGPTNSNCDNAQKHDQNHIGLSEFLQPVQHQLATDRGRHADCTPLHRSGSRGSLFKVCLSTHEYTLVAQGVGDCDRAYLQREQEIGRG